MIYFFKVYALLIPFVLLPPLLGFILPSSGNLSDYGSQIAQLYQRLGAVPVVLVSVMIFVFAVAYLIISFWISAAGIKAVANTLSGSSLGAWKTLKLTWKKLWGFFLVGFLSGLITLGGMILVFILWGILAIAFPISTTITMANSLSVAITVVKAILVIGGLVSFVFVFIFVVWFTFSRFIYIDQKLGVRASLRTSRELVKGKFWAVVGRLFVFGLFTPLLGFIVSIIPYGMGGVVTALFGALFVLPYFLLYRELSGSGSPTV